MAVPRNTLPKEGIATRILSETGILGGGGPKCMARGLLRGVVPRINHPSITRLCQVVGNSALTNEKSPTVWEEGAHDVSQNTLFSGLLGGHNKPNWAQNGLKRLMLAYQVVQDHF